MKVDPIVVMRQRNSTVYFDDMLTECRTDFAFIRDISSDRGQKNCVNEENYFYWNKQVKYGKDNFRLLMIISLAQEYNNKKNGKFINITEIHVVDTWLPAKGFFFN